MKKLLYILAAGAVMLAGCNKENETPSMSGTAVEFTTEITRAAGTNWSQNDQIGVFMKTAAGDISTSAGLNAANVLYATTDASTFTTTTPIYYPASGAVDFIAYYPYRATPQSDPYIYKVNVATQTSPATIDLLYVMSSGVSKSSTPVALQFRHRLSKVVLNIKPGTGMTPVDLAGITAKITNMPTTADFSLATGTFANLSTVLDITPIEITPVSGYIATFTAIIIPQAGAAGRTMVFTAGGDEYTYAIPDADDFVSGKSYLYTITVGKTEISVSRSGTDYNPGGGIDW